MGKIRSKLQRRYLCLSASDLIASVFVVHCMEAQRGDNSPMCVRVNTDRDRWVHSPSCCPPFTSSTWAHSHFGGITCSGESDRSSELPVEGHCWLFWVLILHTCRNSGGKLWDQFTEMVISSKQQERFLLVFKQFSLISAGMQQDLVWRLSLNHDRPQAELSGKSQDVF